MMNRTCIAAVTLCFLFLIASGISVFGQCTPEKDADMAKYKAMVDRKEDVQSCSHCAYLAMLFCSARHSVKPDDVSRARDMISKQKAVIRGMGATCCPELLSRAPQFGVAAGGAAGATSAADLRGEKIQAMNSVSSLVYDAGENPLADLAVNLANSELSRYATDEFSAIGIGLGVGLAAKVLFKKRNRTQAQTQGGSSTAGPQASAPAASDETMINDYKTWGKIKQELGNEILSISSQVTNIAEEVESDIDAFRLTKAEQKLTKALSLLTAYDERTQLVRLQGKLAEDKLDKKDYSTIPEHVELSKVMERLQASTDSEKATLLESHNIKDYKSYMDVMVEPFIVLMKQSAEVAALSGDIVRAEKSYSVVSKLDKQGVLVDESRLRVLYLNGEVPQYIDQCNKLIAQANSDNQTAQELRLRFMLIGAFKKQRNLAAAEQEVERCRQINTALLSSQERSALDKVLAGKWAAAKELPEEFIRNDYALTLEEMDLYREFQQYDQAIALASGKTPLFKGYKAGLNEVDFKYTDFLKIEYLRGLAEYGKQDLAKAEATTNALYERRKNSYDIYYELNQVDVQILKARIAIAQNKLDEARTHLKFMGMRNSHYLPLFEAFEEYASKKDDAELIALIRNKISRLQLESWTDEEEKSFKKSIAQI